MLRVSRLGAVACSADCAFELGLNYTQIQSGLLDAPTIVIHLLRNEAPLCGFTEKATGEWPPNELWTDVPKETTCAGCQRSLILEGVIVLRS